MQNGWNWVYEGIAEFNFHCRFPKDSAILVMVCIMPSSIGIDLGAYVCIRSGSVLYFSHLCMLILSSCNCWPPLEKLQSISRYFRYLGCVPDCRNMVSVYEHMCCNTFSFMHFKCPWVIPNMTALLAEVDKLDIEQKEAGNGHTWLKLCFKF